jgi:hypothetical protein
MSAAIFLLKVIRLLPAMGQVTLIVAEIQGVIDVLDHVSGQGHAQILRQMLAHLRTHLASRPQTRVPTPAPENTGTADDLMASIIAETQAWPRADTGVEQGGVEEDIWSWFGDGSFVEPIGTIQQPRLDPQDPFDFIMTLDGLWWTYGGTHHGV